MRKRNFLALVLFMGIIVSSFAQSNQDVAPSLTYAFEIRAVCDAAYTVGETPKGKRVIIPIVGGSVIGENVNGKIIPGGADHQLVDEKHNRTELEAIYSFVTDDGVYVHVRNRGVLCDGNGKFYFRCTPTFEAPYDSRYAWLNDAIFVCVPGFGDGYISLKMYKVE